MLQHRLVAHRGYQRKYPENTLLAMTEAVQAGARYLETDIQFTRDLVPVLYHDQALARVSGREGFIHDLSAAEATALPASEPFRLGDAFAAECIAPLTALVDFLQQNPEVNAFVEVKEEAVARVGTAQALEILQPLLAPLGERAVLISFDADFIAHARVAGYPRVGLVLKTWAQADSQHTGEIDPEFVFVNAKLIPDGDDLARFAPLLVVYEIADPQQAIALFERGADMVETFNIGGMIEALSSHSL